MIPLRILPLFALIFLYTAAAYARWIPYDPFRFQPVDEAERNSAFHDFRYKFERAVETRDVKTLLDLTSTDVSLSLRDSSKRGKAAFVREWNLEGQRARESLLWDRMRETIHLGGVFEDGEFRAPYVFSRWPERFPHLDFFAIITKAAKLHSKPDENSRVLETFTQEIVGRFDAVPNPAGWKSVRAPSGATGYVKAEDARSPLDYRAIFRQTKDGWKLALFASGDWEAHERLE